MLNMLLRMSGSTLLYILVTAVLWRLRAKTRDKTAFHVLVGIVFGLCCVVSTHAGVDYFTMVLNVRDIGPLAAGLLFSPLSGIIAGLIGGVERYLSGTFWYIGHFTRVACGISTALAGILSALLGCFVLRRKRPPLIHAFFVGALMEVFHMYAVLITHRTQMREAYYVVKVCSIPMILFTGIGLAACSGIVYLMSGQFHTDRLFPRREETSVSQRLQRALLAVTLLIVFVNFYSTFQIHTRIAHQDAATSLSSLSTFFQVSYHQDGKSLDEINRFMEHLSIYEYSTYIVFDGEGNIKAKMFRDGDSPSRLSDHDLKTLTSRPDGNIFTATLDAFYDTSLMCLVEPLGDGMKLMVGIFTALLYERREDQMYADTLSDILLFSVLYMLIYLLMDSLVIRNLTSVNRSLRKIIGGDLNEQVTARGSLEFALLSDDINQTVTTLKAYISASEKRMERELRLAAAIQESALPRVFTFPRKDFEVYALMHPARHVGGDFYDFFFVGADKLALVVADVSGKGVPAALFMMRSKTAIENMARTGSSPADIFYEVNNILCEGNDTDMFVTAWIGMIDLRTGLMECANAGHEYPVLMRAGEDYALIRQKHSPALAVAENMPMREYSLTLNPGDRLFVYSDGVPEAINEREEQYTTGRLTAKLNTLKSASQEQTLEQVRQDIRDFTGSAEQFDDITMLGFTYLGAAASAGLNGPPAT